MTSHLESGKYLVSLKQGAHKHHSPQDLAQAVESLSGEIVNGRGHAALTVLMRPENARDFESDVDFADIVEYAPLALLRG